VSSLNEDLKQVATNEARTAVIKNPWGHSQLTQVLLNFIG